MTVPTAPPPRRTRLRRIADRELTRDDWLAVARRTLIEEGIASVKVERLAKTLGVTRGGFYWRFRNLDDLHRALLEEWRRENGHALVAAADRPGDLPQRFNAMVQVWVEERDFSPAWDSAVRDWARTSAAVAEVVHAVDEERVAALQRMFRDAGLAPDPALVRARIIYYHQVGYYALGIRQDPERRRALLPLYQAVLTGVDPQGATLPHLAGGSPPRKPSPTTAP